LQRKVIPAVKLVVSTYGVPGIKHVMDLRGYYGGPARAPFLPLDEQAKQELAGIAHTLEATA
jgi:4-hydroxy-2-oxoglutarate aldolase